MQYEVKGAPFPVVCMNVNQGESIICQRGGMSWMSSNMQMQTSGGGLGKMFSKAITGESMFQNTYTAMGGPGLIAVGSGVPGTILPVPISPQMSIVAQKSAFLASETGVSFEVTFQKKLGGALFGGEGLIMQRFTGNGMLFLEIDGSVVEYNLAPGQQMQIDTGNLAAMDATVTMDVQTVKGIGNAFLGGEGFFNTLCIGPGRIWLQTMPLPNFASTIARFIPTKG